MAQPVRLTRVIAIGFTLCLCAAAWAKQPGKGAGGDPYDAARDAEARLDYKAVVTQATRALDMANTHDRLVDLYRMLGTAYGVLGKSDDAVEAFTRLLAIDPDHRLPRGTSPKITTPFKEAGGYWIDRPGGLQVTPSLPAEGVAQKPLTIPVKLDDPLKMAANVRASYRIQGELDFKKLETPAAPNVTFTIAPEQLPVKPSDYVLELYFTAVGPTGSELRLSGDAAHPLTLPVRTPKLAPQVAAAAVTPVATTEAPAKKPMPALLKKWWFWTAVGAVVVVGASLGGGLGYYYSRDTSHVDVNLSSRIGP